MFQSIKGKNELAYTACILEALDFVKNTKLQVDSIMKRAIKLFFSKDNMDDIKMHVKSFLQQCEPYESAEQIKICLFNNTKRFGFKPEADFDPQLKLNKDISDLIPVKEDSIVQQCINKTKPEIYYIKDVFVS